MEKQIDLNSFDGIVNNYLKADNLKGKKGSFVCEDLSVNDRMQNDGSVKKQIEMILHINGEKYIFAVNYTNSKILKSLVKKPSDLKGKTIYWEKIKVKNPRTNMSVDGISITDVKDGSSPDEINDEDIDDLD